MLLRRPPCWNKHGATRTSRRARHVVRGTVSRQPSAQPPNRSLPPKKALNRFLLNSSFCLWHTDYVKRSSNSSHRTTAQNKLTYIMLRVEKWRDKWNMGLKSNMKKLLDVHTSRPLRRHRLAYFNHVRRSSWGAKTNDRTCSNFCQSSTTFWQPYTHNRPPAYYSVSRHFLTCYPKSHPDVGSWPHHPLLQSSTNNNFSQKCPRNNNTRRLLGSCSRKAGLYNVTYIYTYCKIHKWYIITVIQPKTFVKSYMFSKTTSKINVNKCKSTTVTGQQYIFDIHTHNERFILVYLVHISVKHPTEREQTINYNH